MKINKLWLPLITGLLFTAFIGCKDENVEQMGMCPVVILTTPGTSQENVQLDRNITITFNGPINPATVTPEVFTLTNIGLTPKSGRVNASEVSGSLTYNAEKAMIIFTPDAALDSESTYTGTVKTMIKDQMGNALQTPYIWSFNTGTSYSPTVNFTQPENEATNIVLNTKVIAKFSTQMDASSINSTTFTLSQGTSSIAGSVSYLNSIAKFSPSADLLPNTIYTATITKETKDLEGISLVNNHVWTFTTGSTLAPQITSTDPEDQENAVALNKVLNITFSEEMNVPSVLTSFTLKDGDNIVSGQVNYAGTTATFTPDENLLSGTTYTATVTNDAQNSSGTPIANDYVWTFNTNPTLGGPFVVLNSVERFGIIAGVGVSNNAGFSKIRNLDIGISPGIRSSITGFPPAVIENGAMYASDDLDPPGTPEMLTQAKQDLMDAYLFAEGATTPAPNTVAGDQGGLTLAPGIYKSESSLLIQNGNLTLDAQGDANAVWIFQVASDFTTIGSPTGGSVILIGGAQAKNVFWQVGSSATIGDYTSFQGNVLALTTITMNSGATAVGRMLAINGSVVMTDSNIIDKP